MGEEGAHQARAAWFVVAGLVAFTLVLAGCGGSSGDSTSKGGEELQELGKGEGQLNLVSWPGYVELGWVAPFQKATGCKVNGTVAESADEMVQLMSSGRYDGVSAFGDVSGRLVESGEVSPINVDLVPNYETVFDDLKDQPYDTFDGAHYGIPQGRSADLLMWNSEEIKSAPTSWNVMLDPKIAAKYKGKLSVYDDPMYIANAALYLKAHEPSLGIENPYELNAEQFDAAVKLLKEQRPNVDEYWKEANKQFLAFSRGNSTVGITWQNLFLQRQAEGKPVEASPASQGFLPKEGTTGRTDTWMISSKARHPNCMYEWMNWTIEPEINALVAEWVGEAPSQSLACNETEDKEFCAKYHADSPGFWKRVDSWVTPLADCGNGEEDCVGYNDWVRAWKDIKR